MSFHMGMIPGEPILFQTWYKDFDFGDEFAIAAEKVNELLDAQPEQTFLVTDMRGVHVSLADMIATASINARSSHNLFHHEKIREVVLVTSSGMIKAGAKRMNGSIFGDTQVQLFRRPEQALNYCRSQIGTSHRLVF